MASWRVADMKYEAMKNDKKCLAYKFLLIGKQTFNPLQASPVCCNFCKMDCYDVFLYFR